MRFPIVRTQWKRLVCIGIHRVNNIARAHLICCVMVNIKIYIYIYVYLYIYVYSFLFGLLEHVLTFVMPLSYGRESCMRFCTRIKMSFKVRNTSRNLRSLAAPDASGSHPIAADSSNQKNIALHYPRIDVIYIWKVPTCQAVCVLWRWRLWGTEGKRLQKDRAWFHLFLAT